MIAPSAAHRVRARFVSFGFWTAVVVFVVIEGDALLDQSEIGHASILFMVGTACLADAACITLFAITTATALVVSAAFNDESPPQQPPKNQDAQVVAAAHTGPPQPDTLLVPGRPKSHCVRRLPLPSGATEPEASNCGY
jgi:hypothetical protein